MEKCPQNICPWKEHGPHLIFPEFWNWKGPKRASSGSFKAREAKIHSRSHSQNTDRSRKDALSYALL